MNRPLAAITAFFLFFGLQGSRMGNAANMQLPENPFPTEIQPSTITGSIPKVPPSNLQFDFQSSITPGGTGGGSTTSSGGIAGSVLPTGASAIPGTSIEVEEDLTSLDFSQIDLQSLIEPRIVGCEGSLGTAPVEDTDPSDTTKRCAPGLIRVEKIGFGDAKVIRCLGCGTGKRVCRNGLTQLRCVERAQ